MIWRWGKRIVTVFISLLLLLMFVPDLLLVPIPLVLGWVPAAGRIIGRWHPQPGSLVLYTLAIITLVAGSHAFFRWLYAAGQKSSVPEPASPRVWRWRWTFCGWGVVVCTLLAVVSVVLTAHQIYWISQSANPWFVSQAHEHVALIRAAADVRNMAEECQWDTVRTRSAFWRLDAVKKDGSVWEKYRVLWVEKDKGTLSAIVLVPYKPMSSAGDRFALLQPGTNFVRRSLSELPQVLASFGMAKAVENASEEVSLLP